jgi:PAS domain S-box-containing protein
MADRANSQAELELHSSQSQLGAEASALMRLTHASSRLWRIQDLREGLDEILAATIELLGADKGNVQLFDATRGVLTIAAHRGFEQPFLDFFREVSADEGAACGRALRSGQRIIIEDVETDEPFTPLRPIAREAGYRAVQSTPLIGPDGKPLGMISTHFRSPHRPSDHELQLLDLYARQAADFIERCKADQALRDSEERLRRVSNNASVGLTRCSRDLRYLSANPAYAEIVGLPLDRIIGHPLEEVMGKQALEAIRPYVERALRGEHVVYDTEVLFAESGRRYLHVSYTPDQDSTGQVVGWVACITDITEHKLTEEALGMSEAALGQSEAALGQSEAALGKSEAALGKSEAALSKSKAAFSKSKAALGKSKAALGKSKAALHDREERLRAILNTAADAIVTINRQGIIIGVNPATERMFGYSQAEMLGQNVKLLMPPPYRDEHDEYLRRYLESRQPHIIGKSRELTARRRDGSVFPVELIVSEIDHMETFIGMLHDVTARKQLQKQVLEVAVEEQRRIGQELHDGTQQELTGLSLLAATLLDVVKSVPEERTGEHSLWHFGQATYSRLSDIAMKLCQGISNANLNVKQLAHGILPVQIDAQGLSSALEELAATTNDVSRINCRFDSPQPVGVANNTTATNLYRIAQEAVNNALRHSHATDIVIALAQDNGQLRLEVRDNGIGINTARSQMASNNTQHMGLQIMEYRASLIGGSLRVEQAESGGTLVRCVVLRGR